MKNLIIMAMCFASATLFAAQCKGLTQKGERCKREADPGSAYCIGHADQAKKADAAKKTEAAPKADAAKKADAVKKEKETKKTEPENKAPADAKLKDDGTCWAITEAGTRCKHKKDGESDYCKQHAADLKPTKPVAQCRALTYGGKQCERKPVEGGRYCPQHNK